MSIYSRMEQDWETYCLMSSIAYIEEISKPLPRKQIKRYKDKTYDCLCFSSIRLKMKDEEVVKRLHKLTQLWERRKNSLFIGKSFNKIRKENYSGQDCFYLSPLWLNHVIAECGQIPNTYSFKTALKRCNHLKQYKQIPIDQNKNLFNFLFKDKKLAAGAFIISMDLEFRGIQSGNLSLCMSEKFKDFLNFMLKVAQRWNWTKNKDLVPVSVAYSKKLGINASPQYEFRISIEGLKEIYQLAGPLMNSYKNKCLLFHINRSKKYINLGGGFKKNKTKEKILKELNKNKDITTTDLQFVVGVRTDVILDHLHKLEKEGKVVKERKGKRYIWNAKWQQM